MKQYTIFEIFELPEPEITSLEEKIGCHFARGYKAGYLGFDSPICRYSSKCDYQVLVNAPYVELYLCGKKEE